MKPATFIDTSYFLALLNSRDKYHQIAKTMATKITPLFITSDAILFELGNALARPPHRQLGILAMQQIRADVTINVVPIDANLMNDTVSFYLSRPDKAWGMTDCSSFVIMQTLGLQDALTTDKHFEQAGFQRLLSLP